MAANNLYFPQIARTYTIVPENYIAIDNKLTGLPLKISITDFITGVIEEGLLDNLPFVQSVTSTNGSIDNTDPLNPILTFPTTTDTNFAENNLVFDGNRSHNLNTFTLTLNNAGDISFINNATKTFSLSITPVINTYFSVGDNGFTTTANFTNNEASGTGIRVISNGTSGIGAIITGDTRAVEGIVGANGDIFYGNSGASKTGVRINTITTGNGAVFSGITSGIGIDITASLGTSINITTGGTGVLINASSTTEKAIEIIHTGNNQSNYATSTTSAMRGLRISAKTEGILIDDTSYGIVGGIGLNSETSIGTAIQGTSTGATGVAIYAISLNNTALAIKSDGAIDLRDNSENTIIGLTYNGFLNLNVPTGRAGVSVGQVFKDTAANILSNNDLIYAIKV